jgi:hypothetical protein
MRAIVLAAALAATLPALTAAAADAQTGASAPTVRARLRDQAAVQGFLRGNSADELVIYTSDGRYVHVPRAALQSLEVRQRTGSQVKRGAMMGVFLWASLMFAASIDRLEDAGAASWESGAILGSSVALGAAVGKSVPRYGWVPTEPGRLTGAIAPPPVRLSLGF